MTKKHVRIRESACSAESGAGASATGSLGITGSPRRAACLPGLVTLNLLGASCHVLRTLVSMTVLSPRPKGACSQSRARACAWTSSRGSGTLPRPDGMGVREGERGVRSGANQRSTAARRGKGSLGT